MEAALFIVGKSAGVLQQDSALDNRCASQPRHYAKPPWRACSSNGEDALTFIRCLSTRFDQDHLILPESFNRPHSLAESCLHSEQPTAVVPAGYRAFN